MVVSSRDAADAGDAAARSGPASSASSAAEQVEDHAPLLGRPCRRRTRAPCRPSRTRGPCGRSSVASPPSSTISVGPLPSGHASASVGAPPVLLERLALPGEDRDAARVLDRAAGLGTADDDRRGGVVLRARRCCTTPSARRRRGRRSVSISTAVCMVMCSEPMMRAPVERLLAPRSARAAPSGRASPARRGGSPCGRTRRARGRRP